MKRAATIAIGSAVVVVGLASYFVAQRLNQPASTGAAESQSVNLTPESFRNDYSWQMDGDSLEEMSDAKRARKIRDQEWEQFATFEPIADDGVDRIVSRLRPGVIGQTDLLPARSIDDLLRTIADHLVARTEPTPRRYERLVASSGSLELNPDLASDYQLAAFYRLFVGDSLPGEPTPQELRDDVWSHLAEAEHLFDQYGDPESLGSVVVLERIRAAVQMNGMGLHIADREDSGYWGGYGYRYGIRFARATMTLDEVIARDNSAVVASAHVLVRLVDGRIANWITTWFHDPESDRWIPHFMQSTASKTAITIW
jgi:hypothetical protein